MGWGLTLEPGGLPLGFFVVFFFIMTKAYLYKASHVKTKRMAAPYSRGSQRLNKNLLQDTAIQKKEYIKTQPYLGNNHFASEIIHNGHKPYFQGLAVEA